MSHAAVFGSVARGEARADSDIDVLVELDRNRPMGIFEYARLKLYIDEILDGAVDVVNRRTLKPLLSESILRIPPSRSMLAVNSWIASMLSTIQ